VLLAVCGGRAACGEPDPPERESVEILAAHALARAAIMDLHIVGTPTQRDYRIDEEMLSIASRLAEVAASNTDPARRPACIPDEQTMFRLYLEAATSANDVGAVRKIVDKLVDLDPSDTVAQLRKISTAISDLQTAGERIAKYEQFLGPAGEVIDPSVRSRLAVDAALLLREQGDMKGFAEKIDLALRLDKTNKDAATLGMTFWSQRLSDPVGVLDWKLAVLLADPLDASVYSSIVEHLLSQGAYQGAWRFAKLHRTLSLNEEIRPGENDEVNFDLAEWNADGPDAAIRRLSDNLEKSRQLAADRLKSAMAQGLPSDTLPRPEEVRLSMVHERSRVLAAVALHDMERASLFLGELADTVQSKCQELLDAGRRARGMSEAEARARVNELRAELAWVRLWSGLPNQMQEAVQEVDRLVGDKAVDDATAARLRAWTLLRTGDPEAAEKALKALPDDPGALLGLAMLAETNNDVSTALGRYKDLARRVPGDLIGAFARTRYRSLAHEEPRISDAAAELESDVAASPSWLEAIAENPKKIMSLDAEAVRSDMMPLDRTPVRVTIKNTSEIPLAMGPDKPINSRLLFGPTIDVGAGRLPAGELVHVAVIDRRLRLEKGESVDAIVYPDLGMLSFIAELGLPRQTRVRWRVLQGFRLVDQRMYDAGPTCLSFDMPSISRRLPHRADAVFSALQFALQTGGPREIADAILSIKYQAAMGNNLSQPITAGDVDRLMEVIARRYSLMQRASKIMILCLVPAQSNLMQAQRIDQLASTESDEDVLAVSLAMRVVKPDDPLFNAPNVIRSPRLAALAQMVRDRLSENVRTYATVPVSAPEIMGLPAPAASPEGYKPLDLSTGKPGAKEPRSRPAGPVTPVDPSPLPVLP
jgi:hypothetical protein